MHYAPRYHHQTESRSGTLYAWRTSEPTPRPSYELLQEFLSLCASCSSSSAWYRYPANLVRAFHSLVAHSARWLVIPQTGLTCVKNTVRARKCFLITPAHIALESGFHSENIPIDAFMTLVYFLAGVTGTTLPTSSPPLVREL